MMGVYKFSTDCFYGELSGIFIANTNDVDFLIKHKDNISYYAGEVLGKYSEIFGWIDEDNITLLTRDEKLVTVLKRLNIEVGYDPLYFNICESDMGDEFCPECGIEWSDITVLEYIHIVRDGVLPDGYKIGDIDINVIKNLQSKFISNE